MGGYELLSIPISISRASKLSLVQAHTNQQVFGGDVSRLQNPGYVKSVISSNMLQCCFPGGSLFAHAHQVESAQHDADGVHVRFDQLLAICFDLDTVTEKLHQHGHELLA